MTRTPTLLRLRMVLLVGLALLLSACEFSVNKIPLPGGADTGEDPIEVTATFPDVLDLVPQSTVKLADVTVGKVTDIELEGHRAEVTMEVRRDADLPANTRAEIRQTSLLGEKFVSLRAPDDAEGTLADGAHIGLERTNQNPEVEELLSALSLVLNGGGVAQLKTISSELNNALEGREGSAKSVLNQLSSFMKQLDDNKSGIVNAIRQVNRLSISANKQRDTITTALDELPAALDSIDSQRKDLVKMLRSLSKLSNVGTRVIRTSKTATIDTLEQLQPVLTQFAKSGDDFANAFHVFLTYPFVDEAVGRDPQVARNLHMGDYVNLSIKLDLRVLAPGEQDTLCNLLGEKCEELLDPVKKCIENPALDNCVNLPKNIRDPLCGVLDIVGLCSGAGGTGGNRSNTQPRQPQGGGGPVDDLGRGLQDLLGANRPAPGGQQRGGRSVKLGQMMEDYDPTMVAALLPGVAR